MNHIFLFTDISSTLLLIRERVRQDQSPNVRDEMKMLIINFISSNLLAPERMRQ